MSPSRIEEVILEVLIFLEAGIHIHVFCGVAILENFSKFTETYLRWRPF